MSGDRNFYGWIFEIYIMRVVCTLLKKDASMFFKMLYEVFLLHVVAFFKSITFS